MGAAFHGAAVITLDAKGRVAIPTRHRAALLQSAKSLVVTAHPDGCVLIYPEAAWEPVRSRVEEFPAFNPQASWWKRLLLGFEELAPDAGDSFFGLFPLADIANDRRHRLGRTGRVGDG